MDLQALLKKVEGETWQQAWQPDSRIKGYVTYLCRGTGGHYLYKVQLEFYGIWVYKDANTKYRKYKVNLNPDYNDFVVRYRHRLLVPSTWPIKRLWKKIDADYQNRTKKAEKAFWVHKRAEADQRKMEFDILMKEGC